jgi:aminopeptidase
MQDPRVEKLAEVIVDYSTGVQPGDEVVIQGSTLAEPLLDAVFTRALQAGGHPKVLVWLPRAKELKFGYAFERSTTPRR